ncbi:long-chain fatty acid--CoA ligase [Rhodospirillaceae bacterium KN72]|uniref:Long-chain fatty acid--CoA ligase n=1 Tax=Pacificispira spongiicola TaxID=2729598 RepID=A0A7Y0DWH1_9PROT|nr:AMP-binding protein [Pacificispira spongiicola]NMM42884.1 long-chain fatty acid--CoA ligase [Pacificispira spongiicola]
MSRTLDLIAAVEKARTAIEVGERHYSYGQLQVDVLRAMSALQGPLTDHQRVVVEWGDVYRHVVLTLALEGLGLCSGSILGIGDSASAGLIMQSDAVIAMRPPDTPVNRPIVIADEAWWRGLGAFDRGVPVPWRPEMPHRLASSSGTTGTPRATLRTYGQSEHKTHRNGSRNTIDAATRMLLRGTFTFQATHLTTMSCLRAGATVVFDRDRPFSTVIRERAITHAVCVPLDLMSISGKDMTGSAVPHLTIMAVGGRVPAAQRRAVAGLANKIDLMELYGTNETGTIAVMDENGDGVIDADVRVEIVDDDNRVLPMGVVGRIRSAGPGNLTGYLDPYPEDARRFDGEWFLTGDIGRLTAPGRLQVMGRADDVLNLSGIKMAPEVLEARVIALPGIRDACIVSLFGKEATIGTIFVLVLDPGMTMEVAVRSILTEIPQVTTAKFFQREDLPRTQSGKLRREEIRQFVSAALARPTKSK